jgi:hypothetical protein
MQHLAQFIDLAGAKQVPRPHLGQGHNGRAHNRQFRQGSSKGNGLFKRGRCVAPLSVRGDIGMQNPGPR